MIESPEPSLCYIEDFKNHYLFNFIQQKNGQNMARISIIGLVWGKVYQLLNWSETLLTSTLSDQFKSWSTLPQTNPIMEIFAIF